jgi:hypothetical protein
VKCYLTPAQTYGRKPAKPSSGNGAELCPLATEDSTWSAAACVFGRLAGSCQHGPYVSLTVERLGDHTDGMEKFSLEARTRVLMQSAATAPAGRAAETI